eukprot:gene9034-27533_t
MAMPHLRADEQAAVQAAALWDDGWLPATVKGPGEAGVMITWEDGSTSDMPVEQMRPRGAGGCGTVPQRAGGAQEEGQADEQAE